MYIYKEFVILEIDTRLVKHLKLYIDPTFLIDNTDIDAPDDFRAYYTYDTISPLAINIY
jgi:hypothetical protein